MGIDTNGYNMTATKYNNMYKHNYNLFILFSSIMFKLLQKL